MVSNINCPTSFTCSGLRPNGWGQYVEVFLAVHATERNDDVLVSTMLVVILLCSMVNSVRTYEIRTSTITVSG